MERISVSFQAADVNVTDSSGRSALHVACGEGSMEAVSLLLACR